MMSRPGAAVLAAMRPADGRYGLELMDVTGLSSGSLYAALVRLRRAGLVEARPGVGGRHAYVLTARGITAAENVGTARPTLWYWWLAATVTAVVTVVRSLARPAAERLPDFEVYVGALTGLRHGHSLYDFASADGAPFTYPPFAGLVLAPVTMGPAILVQGAWTLATVSVVAGLARLVTRTRQRSPTRWDGEPVGLIPIVATVLLAAAPVASDLRYGQVSIFIAGLVLVDVLIVIPGTRVGHRLAGGALVGLAAAVKLTPLIFVPMLWLAGRRRAAVTAAGAFAASAALAWLVLPADSIRYWLTEMWRVNRLGPITSAGNQSLNGALLRLQLSDHIRMATVALAAGAMAILALRRAARSARGGDWFAAAVITGAASIVVSPVSWTHHQIWLVLAALMPVGASRTAQAAWMGLVCAVMVLPVTSLGGVICTNARLLLAVAVACAIPIDRRHVLAAPVTSSTGR